MTQNIRAKKNPASALTALIAVICLLLYGYINNCFLYAQTRFHSLQGEVVTFPATKIDSPLIPRLQAGEAIYRTNFGTASDYDEDLWPDGWTQYFGEGYPRFMQVGITSRRSPFGGGCLEIPVQRGATAVFSPRVEILQGLTYVGYAHVFSQGLQHNRVFISISLLDADGRILETTVSGPVVNTEGWIPLATSPVTVEHPEAHGISLGLHVVPFDRQDLRGLVMFGEVSISEQPTIQFDRKTPWRLYTNADAVELSGKITASPSSWYGARLEIRDAYGHVIESRPLAERGRENGPTGTPDDGNGTNRLMTNVGQYGFHWNPPITEPGYYEVVLSLPMPGIDPYTLEPKGTSRSTSFALLEPQGTIVGGDFGWSLPADMTIQQCHELRSLLETAGISRLKFPVWLTDDSPETAWRDHTLFCEWLTDRGIWAIGVLGEPPDELSATWQRQMNLVRNGVPVPPIRSTATAKPDATANPSKPVLDIGKSGNIFILPQEMWLPSVKSTVFRLGMIVPQWQLGRDGDLSLGGFDGLDALLGEIDTQLQQQGLDASIGLPWNWVFPIPQYMSEKDERMPQGFLSLENPWPLTVDDLTYYLEATKETGAARYVMFDLPDKRRYSLESRITDLVRQMIAAKEHGADALFLARPFDENSGLFDLDGRPGELFLPWRTTASVISGKRPVGAFNMPGGSENHLFRGPAGTVMVVWNQTPGEERLFLGKDSVVLDVWGKKMRPEIDNFNHRIPVGPVPVFITNLHHDAAMIRANCVLDEPNIPSRYGQPIPNTLYFTNTTGEALSGWLSMVPPPGVVVEPKSIQFHLMSGETLEQNLTFLLNAQAVSGEQNLRIDVQANLRDAPLFGVYLPINIGGGDVSIDLSTRLNRNDELEVQQAFINDGRQPANFTCTLYIPNRPLQKMQVRNQGFGRSDHTYTIPNGRALIGKPLRIVAKEADGRRVLRYEITAKP